MAKEQLSAEQIAAMQEKLAALEEENQILRTEKTTGLDFTGTIVKGKFVSKLETPDGETMVKIVQFKPGYVKCRLKDGDKVWSEDLMTLANGGELSEESKGRSPRLINMDSQSAAKWMTELVKKGASFLREVK